MNNDYFKGLIYGLGAFAIWGLVPVYWRPLHHVDAFELMFYRVFWLLVFNVTALIALKKHKLFLDLFKNKRTLKILTLSGFLIGTNWLIFIWGVNNDQVKEVSLGYFINPLFNVVLGAIVLKEKLKPVVWGCVGLAFLGVSYLAFSEQLIPEVAITLALTFGLYGLIKKTLKVDTLVGLTFEAIVVFVIMTIGLMLYDGASIGQVHALHWGWMVYLSLAGIVTLAPLLLFNMSARLIPLSTLGFIQYLAPTLQFMVAIFVLKESLNENYLMAFSLIWLALIFFSVETLKSRKQKRVQNQDQKL